MKRLSIIGGGRVGQTLGFLWNKHQVFKIHELCNRSKESASRARDFILAGDIKELKSLSAAEIFLITVPDQQIEAIAKSLRAQGLIEADTIIFHCSGALESKILGREPGIAASIHPLNTFALPQDAAKNFEGTYCGMEGDAQALKILGPAFKTIGGNIFEIKGNKLLYHAACVLASNFQVALVQEAQALLEGCGLEQQQTLKALTPILRQSVSNIINLGPSAALTGPLARGDLHVIKQEVEALRAVNPGLANVFMGISELIGKAKKKE